MTNTKKIIATFSAVVLLMGSALPVLADSTIQITGNGSDSSNTANVTVTQTTQVQQSNTANISNDVNSSANTGGNQASHNTGGSVVVDTGNAKTDVKVANTANSNVAKVNDCGCQGDTAVTVSGNGDGSKNTAKVDLSNQVQVGQTNDANISNNVKADSNSGKNDANHNTGGSVSVSTGNATTGVDLMTNANQNLAQVGTGSTNGVSGNGATVAIVGNGSDSKNTVKLGLTDWVVLGQANQADVMNSVDAKSNTGKNTANDNTGGNWLGGDVTISTGNAMTGVSADTAVNFNDANVGCDCLTGVTAKIAGNGASSDWGKTDSKINASLVNGQDIAQANGGEGIYNDLYGNSKSGDNKNSSNTGATMDPAITTGDSTSTTSINNQGNANIFGPDSVIPFPWNGSNTNVSVTFSLQDLLSALGIH